MPPAQLSFIELALRIFWALALEIVPVPLAVKLKLLPVRSPLIIIPPLVALSIVNVRPPVLLKLILELLKSILPLKSSVILAKVAIVKFKLLALVKPIVAKLA